MPYIKYNIHPDDPEATEAERSKAYGRFFLGFIVLWGSVGSIIYFICSVVSLFNNGFSMDIFYSVGLVLVMSVIDFFSFFSSADRPLKKEIAKKFYLFFIGGLLGITGMIGMIVSITLLCHDGNGIWPLICSVIGTITVACLVMLVYNKLNGIVRKKIHLFTVKSSMPLEAENSNIALEKTIGSSSDYIYCHKCGKKMLSDSEYCNSCGAKFK